MKVHVLVENKTYRPAIVAEHGLSLLIRTGRWRILFDSGQTDALVKNAAAMKIDLASVDFAVLSHGHFDHSGGFPAFLEKNKKAPVYIHRKAFGDFFDPDEDGNPSRIRTGIAWDYEDLKDRILLTKGPVWIDENLVISGTIDRDENSCRTESFWCRQEDGSMERDSMEHEQFLAVREGAEFYLFSGCSHRGIEAAVRQAGMCFPGTKLKAVFAGLHFFKTPPAELDKRIDALEKLDALIVPLHCTGLDGIWKLKERLGDACIVLHAGDTLEL